MASTPNITNVKEVAAMSPTRTRLFFWFTRVLECNLLSIVPPFGVALLREIEQDISAHQSTATKILDDFEIVWIGEEQLNDDIAKMTKKAPTGTSPDHVYVGRFNPSGNLDAAVVPHGVLREFMKYHREKRWLTSQFLRYFRSRKPVQSPSPSKRQCDLRPFSRRSCCDRIR